MHAVATDPDGRKEPVLTETLGAGGTARKSVNGMDYVHFINDRRRMLRTAVAVRSVYKAEWWKSAALIRSIR